MRSRGSIMRSPPRPRAAYRPAADLPARATTRVSREPTMIKRRHVGGSPCGRVERRRHRYARPGVRRRGRTPPASMAADAGAAARAPCRAATAAPATPDCRARSTKPAPAAASSRRSISSQGLRLSDSDSAQKSWPSGAPIRAATASIAVMPGTNATSSARQLSGPRSISSHTAAAMANTPGSPPETMATRAPARRVPPAPRRRAHRSSRLSDACRLWPARAGTRSR